MSPPSTPERARPGCRAHSCSGESDRVGAYRSRFEQPFTRRIDILPRILHPFELVADSQKTWTSSN